MSTVDKSVIEEGLKNMYIRKFKALSIFVFSNQTHQTYVFFNWNKLYYISNSESIHIFPITTMQDMIEFIRILKWFQLAYYLHNNTKKLFCMCRLRLSVFSNYYLSCVQASSKLKYLIFSIF